MVFNFFFLVCFQVQNKDFQIQIFSSHCYTLLAHLSVLMVVLTTCVKFCCLPNRDGGFHEESGFLE